MAERTAEQTVGQMVGPTVGREDRRKKREWKDKQTKDTTQKIAHCREYLRLQDAIFMTITAQRENKNEK